MLVIYFISMLLIASQSMEVHSNSCQSPLGMKDRRIKDGQLTAMGGASGTKGKDARLDVAEGWCSKSEDMQTEYDPDCYLQIDLLNVHKITVINISGGKSFKDHVPGESAQLSFKINEKSNYMIYKKELPLKGVKYSSPRFIKLEPPIVTRYLKYQPKVDVNSKCMTIELYGCPLDESNCQTGILSNSMRYDASSTQDKLSPTYIGPMNPHLPWGPNSNSPAFTEFVTIDLRTAYLITGVRTFEPKYLNAPKKQPESFKIYYGDDGKIWTPYTAGTTDEIKFNTTVTVEGITKITPIIAAKHIKISPKESKLRYLKLQFYGCLLSDTNIFQKTTALPVTSAPTTTQITKATPTKKTEAHSPTGTFLETTTSQQPKTTTAKRPKTTHFKTKQAKTTNFKPPSNAGKQKDDSSPTLMIVIIVLVVLLLVIIVLFVVFLFRWRRKVLWKKIRCGKKRRRRDGNEGENNVESNQLLNNLSKNPIYEVSLKREDDEAGHLYSDVTSETGNGEEKQFLPEQWSSKRQKNAESLAVEHLDESNALYADPSNCETGYTEVAVEMSCHGKPPVYAEPDAKNEENIELNPIYDTSPADNDSQIYEKAKNLYEGTKIYEDPYQTVTGSSLYADPDIAKERASTEIKKFPRDRLRFLEKIGTGQFGEVHICEVESLGSIIGADAGNCSWVMSSTIKVAVKMLKSDVEKNIEKEFMKEVRVMARLQHENVVQLLGVCDEEPKCMVVEYMENGDLNQFLKGYSLTDGLSDTAAKVLNEQTLLYMCMQISGGMNYLSSQGFVHRDLATRNCLVGHSFTVKISDFGMSRYLYSKHYYRIEGRAVLPIRWMAPESLFYGTFTSQSDVWAFGVTLWEIFTFARETPYEMMSDQQVIENACSVVAKEQKSFRCLPRPDACSNHVYRLLLNCWKRSPKERPSFNEIHWFFKRLVNSTEESI